MRRRLMLLLACWVVLSLCLSPSTSYSPDRPDGSFGGGLLSAQSSSQSGQEPVGLYVPVARGTEGYAAPQLGSAEGTDLASYAAAPLSFITKEPECLDLRKEDGPDFGFWLQGTGEPDVNLEVYNATETQPIKRFSTRKDGTWDVFIPGARVQPGAIAYTVRYVDATDQPGITWRSYYAPDPPLLQVPAYMAETTQRLTGVTDGDARVTVTIDGREEACLVNMDGQFFVLGTAELKAGTEVTIVSVDPDGSATQAVCMVTKADATVLAEEKLATQRSIRPAGVADIVIKEPVSVTTPAPGGAARRIRETMPPIEMLGKTPKPTRRPTAVPTLMPEPTPVAEATQLPTSEPTALPTATASPLPEATVAATDHAPVTAQPTPTGTQVPVATPTPRPTQIPTLPPLHESPLPTLSTQVVQTPVSQTTPRATLVPHGTPAPTLVPTPLPSPAVAATRTPAPTFAPTVAPSAVPTVVPTEAPPAQLLATLTILPKGQRVAKVAPDGTKGEAVNAFATVGGLTLPEIDEYFQEYVFNADVRMRVRDMRRQMVLPIDLSAIGPEGIELPLVARGYAVGSIWIDPTVNVSADQKNEVNGYVFTMVLNHGEVTGPERLQVAATPWELDALKAQGIRPITAKDETFYDFETFVPAKGASLVYVCVPIRFNTADAVAYQREAVDLQNYQTLFEKAFLSPQTARK